jgi:hypothetical protein
MIYLTYCLTYLDSVYSHFLAFQFEEKPEHIDNPNVIKAPELLIFRDEWDYRIDLWALGCFVSKCSFY